ncbi:hypothetical protein BDY24DRAFT_403391 [Mrakia frigida]|uniref:uncharacterized protein n=1 Tax=Mrakia frigida TaxID=29902 RepID=UPI003FCBF08A
MKKQERATKMIGRRFSPSEVRPFQFRAITTTERDDLPIGAQQAAPDNFGSISIKIYRGTVGLHGMYHSKDRADPATVFDELSVKKKQTTEVASVASIPIPTVAASVRNFHYLDNPQGPPFFEFKFLYKSRSLLLALGVIKPPAKAEPSSTPLINKAKLESSSSKKKVEIIEILSSDEEEESQSVKEAKAAVVKAKKDAALAEEALKKAKQQQIPIPKKRGPEPQLTSILKKPKVEKGT